MVLSVVFAAIFGVGLLGSLTGNGRRPLLLGVAVAVPFYDSAFVAAGPVVVSPYYVGLILYLGLVAFERSGLTPVARDPRRVLVIALWAWTSIVTLVAPIIFEGKSVSSTSGLDEQGAGLIELSHSTSNLAQIAYLTLNVAFVLAAAKTRDVGPWFIRAAFVSGIVVAGAIYFLGLNGSSMITGIFDNSTRNSYAVANVRIRAQFAEPSHLGAFSLAAMVYFAVSAFTSGIESGRRTINVVLAAVSLALMFGSLSATAFAGGAVALLVILILAFPKILNNDLRLPPVVVLLLHLAVAGAVLAGPRVYKFMQDLVEYKRTTESLDNRSLADSRAREILGETLGMGVGLGSNRASSMLFLLVSTVGVVGVALFVALVLTAVRHALRQQALVASGTALVADVSSSFVSNANFASPVLWSLIAVTCTGALCRTGYSEVRSRGQSLTSFP